jgi:hypothetical protein
MDHFFNFPHPISYYLIGGAALAAFMVLAVLPAWRVLGERAFEIIFLLSGGASLFGCRWPIFLWPDPLNPDEGGFIACAMKARIDWVPWRAFDAGSSGPLNCDILALPALFGAEIGFFSARVIGLCLIAGAIGALYYAVKWIYGESAARLSIVPPVLLFSLTKHVDFVHYSSEHFSIFLTTVGLAAAAYLARGSGSKSSRLMACALGGLILGCPVFAKLQAMPIAFMVFVSLAAGIFITPSSNNKKMELLVAGAGLVAIPALFLIILFATGTFAEAVISYYKMALLYVRSRGPLGPSFVFMSVHEYTVFLVISLAVVVSGGAALSSRIKFSRTNSWASLGSILLLLASLFAGYHAHRNFPHYLLFSVIPVSFCVANVLGLLQQSDLGLDQSGVARSLFVVLFLLPLGSEALNSTNYYNAEARIPRRAEELAVARHVKPGDRMAVWGWRPELYVQTKTIMATRDGSIPNLVEVSRYREHFRARFLADLRTNPPRVIVDSVAPGAFAYRERATQGIESFPLLEAFVREHYTQREEVAGVRIFVANDSP